MAGTRLPVLVSPIVGRRYTALDAAARFVDVDTVDGPAPAAQTLPCQVSFRGCCYNPLTKTLLVCDPAACYVCTFDVEIRSDTELLISPRGQIGDKGSGAGKFLCPVAIDISARGEIAVADFKLNRVSFFTGSGNALHYFGKTGSNRGEFRGLSDLKFTPLGHVAVADSENHRVQVMTATGGLVLVIGDGVGWRRGLFNAPCALEVTRNGDLFVCDGGNKRIQRFNAKGRLLCAWGSARGARPPCTPQYDTSGFAVTTPPLQSVFETPCDVLVGVNGEILVCDAGRHEVLVFGDTGASLHVIPMPMKPRWSPIAMCTIRNSLLIAVRTPSSTTFASVSSSEQLYDHKLVMFPPAQRISLSKFAHWPTATLQHVISYVTYTDAIQIRLVSHICHRACRNLRDSWQLSPLVPGSASVTKYNQIVCKATGRVAVSECFHKWGLRIFKPANRIRKHVMDFDSGFQNAVSSLFGAMFFYQHEEILRGVFRFHSVSRDKIEIDEAAFVEIVTQIEEIRWGFLKWSECPALCGLDHTPAIRSAAGSSQLPSTKPHTGQQPDLNAKLKLAEDAQHHKLNKLLSKLQSI